MIRVLQKVQIFIIKFSLGGTFYGKSGSPKNYYFKGDNMNIWHGFCDTSMLVLFFLY